MEVTLPIITEAVATLGFPIFCVVALFVFVFLLWRQSARREDILMTEIAHSREINAQFTEILAKYDAQFTEIKTDIREIKHTIQSEKENKK